ncbi:thioredoxin family protein (plasmid) [Sphingomonas sp. NY01]|uniref:thioredoxin family protein n=1 Tax=Sphingomonas sp. NY01 TaxID=2968057 RepID=UPI00315D5C28
MAKIVNVTTVRFDAVVTGRDELVLVDLWSPDCVPCRTLLPILEDLAVDFAGEVAVYKVDVAAEPELHTRLGIRGVPTLALYRDGQEVDRILGLRSRSELSRWIEGHL